MPIVSYYAESRRCIKVKVSPRVDLGLKKSLFTYIAYPIDVAIIFSSNLLSRIKLRN